MSDETWTIGPPPGEGEYWVEWSDGTIDAAWVGPSALCPDRLHVKTFRGDLFPDRDAGKDITRHAPLTRPGQPPGRMMELRPPRTWPAPMREHVAGLRQIEHLAASLAVDDDGILRSLGVALGGVLDQLVSDLSRGGIWDTSSPLEAKPRINRLPICRQADGVIGLLDALETELICDSRIQYRQWGNDLGAAIGCLDGVLRAISSRQDWLRPKV